MWRHPHPENFMNTNTNNTEAKDPASVGCHPTTCSPSLMIDKLMRKHRDHPTVYASDRYTKQLLHDAAATMATLQGNLQEAMDRINSLENRELTRQPIFARRGIV